MKNKKIIIGIIVLLVFALVAILYFLNKEEKFAVSKDYFVKLSGGAGEITYHTYVYETTSTTKKYKYVLTTARTKSWGSSEWEEETNEEGYARSIEDVVDIAKGHHCSYAIYHDKTYSLEEFLKEFLKK